MGKGKAKLINVCLCAALVVTLVTALLCAGIFTQPNNGVDLGVNGNVQHTATYTEDNYLGGIGNDEDIAAHKVELKNNGYVEINTGDELKTFLTSSDSSNGFLNANVTISWDIGHAGFSHYALNKILDGCGHTITLDRAHENEVEINTKVTNGYIVPKSDGNDGYLMQSGTAPDGTPTFYSVEYQCFGGLAAVLQEKGVLRNFKFVISKTFSMKYIRKGHLGENYGGNVDAHLLVGGLVGFNYGGTIENVAVELAAGKEIYLNAQEGLSARDDAFAKAGCNAAIFVGLVTGINGSSASRAGVVKDVFVKMNTNAKITSLTYTFSFFWGNQKEAPGSSLVGGVTGAVGKRASLSNAYAEFGEGCQLISKVGPISGEYRAYKKAGGIVAVNLGGSITTTMVTGNLNCLLLGGTAAGTSNEKSAFVANGVEPSTMIYKNATGGDVYGDGKMDDIAQGYKFNSASVARLDTSYNFDGSSGIMPYFFDKDQNGNVKVFVPEGKLLWSMYGRYVLDQKLQGINSAKGFPNAGMNNKIQLGLELQQGTVGFYNGTTEVSNQTLFYDGTKYTIGIDAGKGVVTEGVEVKASGNLKNAMSLNGGLPVKLICGNSNATEEEKAMTPAYLNDKTFEVLYLNNLEGMEKTLSIKRRYVLVETSENYKRGETTIFDKAWVKFNAFDDSGEADRTRVMQEFLDKTGVDNASFAHTGLTEGERMMWQNEGFANGVKADLNIAGPQLFRPETNNYIFVKVDKVTFGGESQFTQWYVEEIGAYFNAVIAPHQIKVGEGVYINGAAVFGPDGDYVKGENGEYLLNSNGNRYGIYEILNGRVYSDSNKNNAKRQLNISARQNDGHFAATGFEVVTKTGSTQYNTLDGDFVKHTIEGGGADYDNLKNITEIKLTGFDKRQYNLVVKDGNNTELYNKTHNYCERVTLTAAEAPAGKMFKAWTYNGKELSYMPTFSFKLENATFGTNLYDAARTSVIKVPITAVYEDVKAWTVKYYNNYGGLVRTATFDNVTNGVNPASFSLTDNVSGNFAGWTQLTYNATDKVAEWKAVYTNEAGKNKIKYVMDGEVRSVDYGTPIELAPNTIYVVNNVKITVPASGYTIYAISELNIRKIGETGGENPDEGGKAYDNESIKYKVLTYDETKNGNTYTKYYISITFMYGAQDAVYGEGSGENTKPKLKLPGFTYDDVIQYVRCGNIYQISMELSASELECRFGNNSEIATFLTVVDNSNEHQVFEYEFETILIFR